MPPKRTRPSWIECIAILDSKRHMIPPTLAQCLHAKGEVDFGRHCSEGRSDSRHTMQRIETMHLPCRLQSCSLACTYFPQLAQVCGPNEFILILAL